MDLGFEIRGFSCPRHRRSPKKPHVTNFTKQAYQTNPIPASSDNALAPASDNVLAPAPGRPPPPVTPKTHPAKSAKPVCQTDPIPKNQSRPASHGHLPRTASRISPAAAAIENHRSAEIEETRGFSWPAELLIPQSPAPAKLRRSDTSNSLGREPQDHRPKTVSPGRGGTPPFTTNTAHRAAESTAGIPRWNPRYRNPKSPAPPVTRFHSHQINNIPQKHPKTLDSAC